jgi:DNA-binding beta-propeller fold protein YncE
MLALIYLWSAIVLGDLLCRRFYRFTSIFHRWAAAILVGIFLSTWFTYLAGLAFAHTGQALLFADLLFFVTALGAIFWLSKKAPKVSTIAPRAPGSSTWDWITLGALFAAACVLLLGTLYVNKQGRIRLCGMETGDFGPQAAIVQGFAGGRSFPAELTRYASQPAEFLFFFQAGNLEFLGLNLAWSVDVLSLLVLMSVLALVITLGELLFNSRLVGRLGATLFFFHGSLRHLTNFLAWGRPDSDQNQGFWKQVAFVNHRHLSLALGIFLLVLIFLIDRYRQRSSAATPSDARIALAQSKRRHDWNQLKKSFVSRFILSARPAPTPVKSLVFSALLVAALPPWKVPLLIATVVVLCCLFLAYGSWWPSRAKAAAMLGRLLAGTVTACILVAGVIDLSAVYSDSRIDINYEKEPLVKGLGYRNSVIYKIPGAPVTAFEGGHGNGRGQFDSPRGIATDRAGNIFVADTGNGRIEKFSPGGVFLTTIGTKGTGHGQLGEPSGICIDRVGNIYVAEVASNHRVQKLAADGKFIAEWKGPAPGFYGPRRTAIGPDDSVYVVDQGRPRIVKFSPDGRVLATWGSGGSNEGQFADHTSVAVDWTANKVYVADPRNKRVQVFDPDGRFLTTWPVPEWGQPQGFEDLVIDSNRERLYASSANMSWILVFDLHGNRIATLTPTPPDKLEGASGLALTKDRLFVVNATSARVSVINLQNR